MVEALKEEPAVISKDLGFKENHVRNGEGLGVH
jgi:hypothetical protein